MHTLTIATLFLTLLLVGIELSVAAFVNPAAWRLPPEPQLQFLRRLALVLGRVMPVCYPLATLLLLGQVVLRWHTPARPLLLTSLLLWILASLASLLFLVPLNARIAQGAPNWQQLHHTWDTRHRLRTATLALAALLLTIALTP